MASHGIMIPSINVSTHSSGNETFPILEDSLHQVQELFECIQGMRYAKPSSNFKNPLKIDVKLNGAQDYRLCTSCPSLNKVETELDNLGNLLYASPRVPSTHKAHVEDWLYISDAHRRRSWTTSQDLTGKDEGLHSHRRSISLSNIKSDNESVLSDNPDGSNVKLLDSLPRVRNIPISSHSLNESDRQQYFYKIGVKKGVDEFRSLLQKLPFQKSVSMPCVITREQAIAADHFTTVSSLSSSLATKHNDKNKESGYWDSLWNDSFKFQRHSDKISGTFKSSFKSRTPDSAKIKGDDKDSEYSQSEFDEISNISLEFLHDPQLTAQELCSDCSLCLHESEPESWASHVDKSISSRLKQVEVKRQEHIYEFVLTEKHHCMTLLAMQKIFHSGLQKYFNLGPNLERMFPRLNELIDIHLKLLSRLRQRQRENPIVTTIADILVEQFSNIHAAKLKSAYGEFCSRYRDSLQVYKYCLQSDSRFGEFIKHCQSNPLLKKKGLTECILFVTQRLTKYPLLIEPLIKTSKDNAKEQEALQKALALAKDILVEVDAQVALREREIRKKEIYDRIDEKSSSVHRGRKFKKSDILEHNRVLKFEGTAVLVPVRGKAQEVFVVVLSDVLFFLQERSSHKYTFYGGDKVSVISLQKLLVREKAGHDSRMIYLISSNPAVPEMFELKVRVPKDRTVWINAIRDAVRSSPADEADRFSMTLEEKHSIANAKQNDIKHLVGLMRQKDIDQALLLEEKMSIQLQLLATSGLEVGITPSYRKLVDENTTSDNIWKEVISAIQEVSHLTSSLYSGDSQFYRNLVASLGTSYTHDILDFNVDGFSSTRTSAGDIFSGNCDSNESSQSGEVSRKNSFNEGSQMLAIQFSHHIYTLFCIISQLMTSNENLQAQVAASANSDGIKEYKLNQQIEELRNLHDKLTEEKVAWAASKEQSVKELEEKKIELQKMQEQIKAEQDDIRQQREQLYKKMEILTSQGLLISPNVAIPVRHSSSELNREGSEDTEVSPAFSVHGSSLSRSCSASEKRRDPKWGKNTLPKAQLPMNLISTTNQHKVMQAPVKQQIPLKLASLSHNSPSCVPNSSTSGVQQVLPFKLEEQSSVKVNSSGYQRLQSEAPSNETVPPPYHNRMGSSPTILQSSGSSQSSNKESRTHPGSRSDKVKSKDGKSKHKTDVKSTDDEEVIYF